MIPIEKCLVHLVPVHRLSWPSSLTDNTVADLGGNTMHLLAVGALACRGVVEAVWGEGHDAGRPGSSRGGYTTRELHWQYRDGHSGCNVCSSWWLSSFLAHVVIVTAVDATSGTTG